MAIMRTDDAEVGAGNRSFVERCTGVEQTTDMEENEGPMASAAGGGVLGVQHVGWRSGAGPMIARQKAQWKREQEQLRKRLIMEDCFTWQVRGVHGKSLEGVSVDLHGEGSLSSAGPAVERLRLVGGVDISFSKDDADLACASLIVMDIETMRVVYESHEIVRMTLPYIPGYLAFRECSAHIMLINRLREEQPSLMPQVILVDGNGVLHPRGFGLACHIGVVADVATIGIGKNLHCIDGLEVNRVRQVFEQRVNVAGDYMELVGSSGRVWGAALKSTSSTTKPVMVSVGHRISLKTAIEVVRRCCRHRVPEPVRQADIKSRDYLKKLDKSAVPL